MLLRSIPDIALLSIYFLVIFELLSRVHSQAVVLFGGFRGTVALTDTISDDHLWRTLAFLRRPGGRRSGILTLLPLV